PPGFADLLEDGRRRLACHLCDTSWTFGRLACPLCGNRTSTDLVRLLAEGADEGYVIAACRARRGYVKELDRRLRWNAGSALDGVDDPLAWDLAIDEALVPIHYGSRLRDADSLPREESVRARVLSARAIAAVWTTYDSLGVRVDHEPQSPLDPRFYLRRPGGK